MRRKKDGSRWFMDLSLQEQAAIAQAAGVPSPSSRDLLHTHMIQALAHVDRFAPRMKANEALPVVTARAALRNLIEYLERNK